jgi:hypothetical protein
MSHRVGGVDKAEGIRNYFFEFFRQFFDRTESPVPNWNQIELFIFCSLPLLHLASPTTILARD